MLNQKRGISAVLAVVMTIALTVAAGSFIYIVLIPFIKTETAVSQKCYTAELEIVEGEYTYYNSTDDELYVQVKRGAKEGDLVGMQIKLSGGAISKSIEVFEGVSTSVFREFGETGISLPGIEETRTYVINLANLGTTIEEVIFVEVAPIVKVVNENHKCDFKSKIILDKD